MGWECLPYKVTMGAKWIWYPCRVHFSPISFICNSPYCLLSFLIFSKDTGYSHITPILTKLYPHCGWNGWAWGFLDVCERSLWKGPWVTAWELRSIHVPGESDKRPVLEQTALTMHTLAFVTSVHRQKGGFMTSWHCAVINLNVGVKKNDQGTPRQDCPGVVYI